MEPEKIKSKIKKEREQKDEFFSQGMRSPIPASERGDFEGLNYYPVKPELRFKLKLQPYEEKEKVEVQDSQGGKQEFYRVGKFKLTINDQAIELNAYKGDLNEEKLWAPFKDETNDESTYGSGRYLDLDPERHKEDGKWIVDFNQAYNPSCAYNEKFVCPFIPPENWLNVKIKAGEKKYH